jgi:hypothetical protein
MTQKQKCVDFMLKNPPKPGEQGYYDTVAKKFGYKNGEVIRQMAKAAKVPNIRQNSQSNRTSPAQKAKTLSARFVAYLSKARTDKELHAQFGDEYKALLKGKYEGYDFFEQRNHYNELTYILLPEVKATFELLPRQWTYRIGVGEDGTPDPYIVVQLPKFKGTAYIATLFDVHYGHSAHRLEKFRSYIRWIAESPNVYAILGGDLMENALDDGRGMTYDQAQNPSTQLNDVVTLLAPVAHKIICAFPGNHEWRTFKKSGIDPMMVVAQRLNIPYFDGPVFISLLANTHKWTIYAHHGTTNSNTKGGKLNAANRPKMFTNFVHFLLSGHVHDRVAEAETMIVEDPINCRLSYLNQWTVIAPAFLGWKGTYAYRAELRPPAMGGVSIELNDNGSYKAGLTD